MLMLCHYIRSVFGALGIYTLEIGCQWCKKVPRSAIDTPLDEGQLVSRLDTLLFKLPSKSKWEHFEIQSIFIRGILL